MFCIYMLQNLGVYTMAASRSLEDNGLSMCWSPIYLSVDVIYQRTMTNQNFLVLSLLCIVLCASPVRGKNNNVHKNNTDTKGKWRLACNSFVKLAQISGAIIPHSLPSKAISGRCESSIQSSTYINIEVLILIAPKITWFGELNVIPSTCKVIVMYVQYHCIIYIDVTGPLYILSYSHCVMLLCHRVAGTILTVSVYFMSHGCSIIDYYVIPLE